MSSEIPLGRKEDQRLEFKGRDALSAPEKIAREVVGMLNAGGGEVWVGLRDEGGRAVAIEGIATALEAEREIERLRDVFVDRIEPAPLGSEVVPRLCQTEMQTFVIAVAVEPGAERGPYALLKEKGRDFVIRVGDRLRTMTREELAKSFRVPSKAEDQVEKAQDALVQELAYVQRRGEDLFWLRLKPVYSADIDLSALKRSGLLSDPALTGNRKAGSTFLEAAVLGGLQPQVQGNRLSIGRPGFRLEVGRDGALTFETSLEALWEVSPDPRGVYPWALLEYPTSVLRLMSQLYRRSEIWEESRRPLSPVVTHLAILGLGPARLGEGPPGTWGYLRRRKTFEEKDLVLDRPLVFEPDQIRGEPDRCAFRLVKRVYEAFGFDEDAIPQEFDRQTGRLVLPE